MNFWTSLEKAFNVTNIMSDNWKFNIKKDFKMVATETKNSFFDFI